MSTRLMTEQVTVSAITPRMSKVGLHAEETIVIGSNVLVMMRLLCNDVMLKHMPALTRETVRRLRNEFNLTAV